MEGIRTQFPNPAPQHLILPRKRLRLRLVIESRVVARHRARRTPRRQQDELLRAQSRRRSRALLSRAVGCRRGGRQRRGRVSRERRAFGGGLALAVRGLQLQRGQLFLLQADHVQEAVDLAFGFGFEVLVQGAEAGLAGVVVGWVGGGLEFAGRGEGGVVEGEVGGEAAAATREGGGGRAVVQAGVEGCGCLEGGEGGGARGGRGGDGVGGVD